jgi:hypothetical protein
MNRSKIALEMIGYLESTLNCQKVIKFIDRKTKSLDSVHHLQNSDDRTLTIKNILVAFHLFSFENNHTLYQDLISKFDFMTRINHEGFEYFPYLYGVLNCIDDTLQRTYVFSEHTDMKLMNLFNNLEGASDWYDLALQAAMIDYYLGEKLQYYDYGGNLDHFQIIKMEKPVRAEYIVGEELKISTFHKFRLVYWKTTPIPTNGRLVETLLRMSEKGMINLPGKIVDMLTEIVANPGSIMAILGRYYQWREKKDRVIA